MAVADFTPDDRQKLHNAAWYAQLNNGLGADIAYYVQNIEGRQQTYKNDTDSQLANILSAVQSIQNGDVDLSTVESLLTQIRGYVDGLETSTGNIDTSTAASLTSLNQLLQALQSFKSAFDDRDFGTDLQNVEAGMQDIEDAIDRLTTYFVDGEASGIEGDLSSAVSSALQNNGVTSGRMATIEDMLIDMWHDSSNIAGDVARIPSLLTTLNSSVSDFHSSADTYLHGISDSLGFNRQTLLSINQKVGAVPDKLEEIRLLGDESLSELKITRTDNATWRQYVKNGLVEPVYENLPMVAEDVKFSRDYLRRYFAVGGTETNRVVQGIVTNRTPIHGTNGVIIGYTTNLLVRYGTNVVNKPKGIFDEFFYDDSPSKSNSLFKHWYNVAHSNGISIISNQLRQIDYQSNILAAVSSITNLLATNSIVGLANLITNGFSDASIGSFGVTPGDPLSLHQLLYYALGLPPALGGGAEWEWYNVASDLDGVDINYSRITNDLYLLHFDDGNEKLYGFVPFQPKTDDENFYSLKQYDTWLMQSMRDSLALLSFGILDSITNNVDGQMQDFDSDEMEMPSSDELNEFRDEAKSGIETQKDTVETAIQNLAQSGQYSGNAEIVLDFASAGIPGMSERIEIDFNQVSGQTKQACNTFFTWLWRFLGGIYFFLLATKEWDWWISLGRESASIKD